MMIDALAFAKDKGIVSWHNSDLFVIRKFQIQIASPLILLHHDNLVFSTRLSKKALASAAPPHTWKLSETLRAFSL
jgi:hypothetical protein